jgi:hypothetical protein
MNVLDAWKCVVATCSLSHRGVGFVNFKSVAAAAAAKTALDGARVHGGTPARPPKPWAGVASQSADPSLSTSASTLVITFQPDRHIRKAAAATAATDVVG